MENKLFLLQIMKAFLPPGGKILSLKKPHEGPAIYTADVDGDRSAEIVGHYSYNGETYTLVLKKYGGRWQVLNRVKKDRGGSAHAAKANVEKKEPSKAMSLRHPSKKNRHRNPPPENMLESKQGDVNGDGRLETVYLVGNKPTQGSPYIEDIGIVIYGPDDNRLAEISLEENSGYQPTLFLGDFTGDNIDDILVNIDSGGSGGYVFSYIYSFSDNQPKPLFDFNAFNEKSDYTVDYLDYYRVEVTNPSLNKKYVLDISNKDRDYISGIYDENGKLKRALKGDVLPLGALYPIDIDRNKIFEINTLQRIVGLYNADTLGYVETIMRWNGEAFAPYVQSVSIPGFPLERGGGEDIYSETDYFDDILYLYSETQKDPQLERAIAQVYELNEEDEVRYYYNRLDLNGDGRLETIVYLTGSTLCGSGGCSAVIFKQENDKYEKLSQFTLANTPIIISNKRTNGYKDIIMYVSGGGIEPFYAHLKYDGVTYPSNPSSAPPLPKDANISGIAVISDDLTENRGIEWKPNS